MKITQEQVDFLAPLIPNLAELIKQETDDDLLETLDFMIVDELDDTQNFLTSKGIRLQQVYDQIFNLND